MVRRAPKLGRGYPSRFYRNRESVLSVGAEVAALGFDEYAKAVTDAANKLQTAHQMMDARPPGAIQAGTGEAYSAVVKSQMESDMKLRESPQERLARIQTEALAVEKQHLQVAREMAKATQAQHQVVDMP